MNETTNETNAALDAAVAKKIAEHYRYARAKHTYFADRFLPAVSNTDYWSHLLYIRRKCLLRWRKQGTTISALEVLECELTEVCEAYARGDKDNTVEECYDLIAVILRMVDVLEGRQKLGKPKKESEARK